MMRKIGLLSDTHGYWNEKYEKYFAECDEIWHAGDIGSIQLLEQLKALKPVKAVYGNIDGEIVRMECPKVAHFDIENVSVMMTHIGGYPGRYNPEIRKELYMTRPKLFICGHSHLLKVMYDQALQTLVINPGAAGKYGIQQVRTLIRFCIDRDKVKNLEVIELGTH